AGARRAPQDHRAEPPGLDHAPDRPAFAQQMILTHHLVERARPQPVGQGRVGGMDAGGFKQVAHGPAEIGVTGALFTRYYRRRRSSSWPNRIASRPEASFPI